MPVLFASSGKKIVFLKYGTYLCPSTYLEISKNNMLNISKNSIQDKIDIGELSSYKHIRLPTANRMLSWWLYTFLIFTVVIFFLPWTQNIQMKGKVTTLRPEQRPQDVNSTIAGRIERWFIREGELVQAGDTIVFLSEVKSEYFDPKLVDRTGNQIEAKEGSIDNYSFKAKALENQVSAMRRELIQKKEQLQNKIVQSQLKLESNKAAVKQAEANYEIAEFQLRRTDTLYQKGIKSLSDLESKRLKVQETKAKLVSAQNKRSESENDIQITQLQFENVDNEYGGKIAKAESDRFTTISTLFEAKGDLNKLENQFENYSRRNSMYYIIAPQTGYVTKTIKSGIGEMIKAGETIITIVPQERELAVEMYIKPMDLPLMNLGQEVRLIFDGWQAFVISGWSDFSFGTYQGEVVAIDNIPNLKNKYRLLVQSTNSDKPFPDLLRVGAGAEGIALLKDVPVWYEIWRQLNGFPADFYDDDIQQKEDKFKPPVKAVTK
jgi:multidrug resistance efflux pump